jgi:hypothetical protein
MAGLVPAIHVLLLVCGQDVDARHKAGLTTRVAAPLVYFSFVSAFSTVSRVYGFWITGASASSSGIGARSP